LLNKIKMPNYKAKFRSFLTSVYLLLAFFPSLVLASPLVPSCGGGKDEPKCDFDQLIVLVENIINLAIKIAPMLAAVAFAVAGFYYVTAAGDTGKIKQAHDIAITTVWGLVITLVAWVLIKTIITALGADSKFILLNF